jgi:hypothetical protein
LFPLTPTLEIAMSNIINIADSRSSATFGAGPQLMPSRTLVSRGATHLDRTPQNLEGVRDYLAKMDALQAPRDEERSFSQLHLSYKDGRVTGQLLGPDGLSGEPMLVHTNAYRQMGSTLLPPRFGSGLLAQSHLGERGEQLSTLSWALFSRESTLPRMFRVANIKDIDGQIHPCIRAQVSQGYARYSNLQFVQDLLDNSGDLAEMPVVDFRVTDLGFRLRFSDTPLDQMELDKPVAMFEAWNSETGSRKTGINAGAWKLWCTNGCGTWESGAKFEWRHFGDPGRIREGVASAMTEVRTQSKGVVDAYNMALDVGIDDAFAFLERELTREKATKEQIANAQIALTHETTAPGGVLASAVDAITLIAQDYGLFEQSGLERAAGRILNRGRAEGLRSGGRILVS